MTTKATDRPSRQPSAEGASLPKEEAVARGAPATRQPARFRLGLARDAVVATVFLNLYSQEVLVSNNRRKMRTWLKTMSHLIRTVDVIKLVNLQEWQEICFANHFHRYFLDLYAIITFDRTLTIA